MQSGKNVDWKGGDGDYATGTWICIQINRWTNVRGLCTGFYSQNIGILVWFMIAPCCSQEATGYILSENCCATFPQTEKESHSELHQEVLDYLNLTMEWQSRDLFQNRSALTVQFSLKNIFIFFEWIQIWVWRLTKEKVQGFTASIWSGTVRSLVLCKAEASGRLTKLTFSRPFLLCASISLQKLFEIGNKSWDAAIHVQCWHVGVLFIASYDYKAIMYCRCLHSQHFFLSHVMWVRGTFHKLKMESLWQHDHPPPPSVAEWLCHALNKWLDLCNANATLWVRVICIYSIHKAIYSPSAACYFVLLSRESGLQWLKMQLRGASKVERLSGSKAVNVNSGNNYSFLLPCT